jgi:hypothetical protein
MKEAEGKRRVLQKTVIVPFSARHAQVFMSGMQKKGVFSGSMLSRAMQSLTSTYQRGVRNEHRLAFT